MRPNSNPSAHPDELAAASEPSPKSWTLCHGLFAAVLVAGFYILAQYNYLAFHVLAELFSIVVAAALFLLVWHGRAFIGNNSMVALGIAFFFAGFIDLLHALTYKGMGVFQVKDQANAATQLWIAARWLESLSLLAFMWLRGKPIRPVVVLWGYAVLTGLLLWTIFGSRVFPDCFIEGSGLTVFKVASEYAICSVLVCALVMLFRHRGELDTAVQGQLALGIVAAIVSELAFTFYVSVYGLSNLIGHICKIVSFYMVYLALVRSSLTRPYQTLFRELTAARQAFQRKVTELDTILEATADGILAVDENGRVLHANERFRQLWGIPEKILKSADDAELLRFVLHQLKDPQAFQVRVKTLYESKEDEFTTLEFKDGKVVERLSSPLIRAGRVSGRVWSFRDVTAARQSAEALRRLNENLEQQVAERTELAEARARQLQALAMELIEAEEQERRRVADLLHDDLQQVLAAARLQLQAASESLPPEPMLVNVERLLEESIGKSRRLSHELSPAVLHHSGLVAALQWLVRQMGDQFGLQVHLESDGTQQFESAPLKVFMFRAVQELLFNVVKHAGIKTARVVLSGSDSGLAITVSDQGSGFNPQTLDSHAVTGGFGLMSLRERARHIGGSLVIESVPGKGSRFVLTVPISMAGGGELEKPAADLPLHAPAGPPASAGTGDIRVLLADDHQVMRQGLRKLIAGQPGIEVVGEAANGREVIERARQLKPNLIVMDVSMPEMDGIEATRHIKAELPDMLVIGLSMYEDEQLARKMREAGAEAFVSKTASSAELLKTIYGVARHEPV